MEATPDATLEELRPALSSQGMVFGLTTLWRFFDRRGYTLKKRRRTRANRSAWTS